MGCAARLRQQVRAFLVKLDRLGRVGRVGLQPASRPRGHVTQWQKAGVVAWSSHPVAISSCAFVCIASICACEAPTRAAPPAGTSLAPVSKLEAMAARLVYDIFRSTSNDPEGAPMRFMHAGGAPTSTDPLRSRSTFEV